MPRKTTKTLDKLRKKKVVHDDKVCTTNKYYDDETPQQILDDIKSLKKTKDFEADLKDIFKEQLDKID